MMIQATRATRAAVVCPLQPMGQAHANFLKSAGALEKCEAGPHLRAMRQTHRSKMNTWHLYASLGICVITPWSTESLCCLDIAELFWWFDPCEMMWDVSSWCVSYGSGDWCSVRHPACRSWEARGCEAVVAVGPGRCLGTKCPVKPHWTEVSWRKTLCCNQSVRGCKRTQMSQMSTKSV